jgi:hypothetical protein
MNENYRQEGPRYLTTGLMSPKTWEALFLQERYTKLRDMFSPDNDAKTNVVFFDVRLGFYSLPENDALKVCRLCLPIVSSELLQKYEKFYKAGDGIFFVAVKAGKKEDDLISYSTGFRSWITLKAGLTEYPVTFSAGQCMNVNAFVGTNGLERMILVLNSKKPKHKPKAGDMVQDMLNHFAAEYAYQQPMQSCTKCRNFMPSFKWCSRCKVPYCTKECRDADWKDHCKICVEKASLKKLSLNSDTVKEKVDSLFCSVCGADDSLMLCSKCKVQRYCNTECQKKDWRSHKHHCQKALVGCAPMSSEGEHRCQKAVGCGKCGAPMSSEGAMGALCATCASKQT